ncbi:dnaJ homolog subfamily C member 2-like isoform X1 [Coccinella septempunctata]|uniref:dnaJ homolog subfamily C member 2-like isoform X1 n=1 Tax=Coccinella septempunctata TaxID=41139 RepID=UPI001D086368|nr:dnaJ homolog subfamily C member 2-like isoform X1 [Coccinella septempunctata]
MGEARRSQKSCTTVAVRYRFVWKPSGDGEKDLQFLPHKVRKLKHVPPVQDEPVELKPEDVVYLDDVEYLRSLDPKEWKHQDHYKVLGIPTLRIKATDEIIKAAYRKKVLQHHPDKRKAKGEEIKDDDDYFTCITMAYETLGNPLKRRAYDSVDPEFDNNIPSASEIKSDFFKVCSYYFDLNSRWSEKQKVPKLGGPDSTREEVEKFYNYWYDFKSWREYSYEDEEDKEKCTDRDERRYVDKLNKAERLRKKKEEMARIRTLVDLAYNNDPRIAKFKQDDKDRKLAAKRAKQTAAQIKKEEAERALREAQLAIEKAEAAERARIEAKRQEREAQKKLLKKERKALRDICKSNNYYADNPEQNLAHMTALESICENMNINELEQLNKEIKSKGKTAFLKAVTKINSLIENERKAMLEASRPKSAENKNLNVTQVMPEWNEENMQLLVKAVTMFPPGTNQRWEVVANFMNQHGKIKKNASKFNAKMVLSKAKELQNADFSKNNLKEEANKQAFDNFKKNKKSVLNVNENGISKKLEEMKIVDKKPKTDDKKLKSDEQKNNKVESAAWTTEEQLLLEQALKTYPASTSERWDRVAECIPNRTKKECMKRYKELVETVKAKKAAQAAVNSVK